MNRVLIASLLIAQSATAGAALGDWGHFLSYQPKVYLYNPTGVAFTFTVHLFRWAVPEWNPAEIPLRLTGPDAKPLLEGKSRFDGASRRFDVPAGPKGSYLLELGSKGQWVNFWVECSLNHSVVWTGDPHAHAIEGRRLVTQCSVPRRWWFWVPPDKTEFVVKAQRADRYMSQREDWGISVISPRGQQVRVLWGQPPFDPYRADMEARVPVEPGAAGRFWSVEIRLGDSHNYSNINIALEGVPPYLARSPEEWFDPDTGKLPQIPTYDESQFMQATHDKEAARPHLQHWSPCPSLGDPDGDQIRGDASFALWNPEDRRLKFMIGDYLPRTGMHAEPPIADVKVTGPSGRLIFQGRLPAPHHHGQMKQPDLLPPTGAGVSVVEVKGVERWLAYTYPATPLVLIGKDAAEGWRRFTFEVGTVRNWYFFVPPGTRTFAVRAAAEHETDVMHLEVNAPDRTVAMIYGRRGEQTVEVPEGLDGKVWHIRADVGSATRMVTDDGKHPRYLGIYLTLDLRGVPGYLAPTWEQWFHPDHPLPALERARPERK